MLLFVGLQIALQTGVKGNTFPSHPGSYLCKVLGRRSTMSPIVVLACMEIVEVMNWVDLCAMAVLAKVFLVQQEFP